MKYWVGALLIGSIAVASTGEADDLRAKKHLEAVRGIIAAVNARDADAYIANLADVVENIERARRGEPPLHRIV